MKKIPKIIHYCWFGGKELPEDVKKMIDSWKKNCPDYEIKEWNEKNFDLNSNEYVKEAYSAKKWAFISDYARLVALKQFGGIYLDTDVELIKNLDDFLDNDAFAGFETSGSIQTAVIGCKKNFKLIDEFLDYYNSHHFILDNNSFDTTTNVVILTNICKKYGLKLNNKKQSINNFIIFPSDYFCPKNMDTGIIKITDNTHAIHHFSGSWLSIENAKRKKLKYKLSGLFGEKIGKYIYFSIFLPYVLFSHLKEKKENKK